MRHLFNSPAWITRLHEPERTLLLTLCEIEVDLEHSAPIDRLRLLAKVRQAIVEAQAAWGKEGDGPNT
jgi:hypothetical protein